MGNPSLYYKRAIQDFAYFLAYEENNYKLAKELYEEGSEDELEKYILDKKNNMGEKIFFYNAGLTSQHVLNEANEEGCDASNAACGGINEFEYFIGLKEDEEEE